MLRDAPPRTIACVEVRNQHGELTAVAKHVEAWVMPEKIADDPTSD
jgi:hypothetical protein